MGRIVAAVEPPGKRRHLHERSCAEVLRLLAGRRGFDDEVRDMAAFLAFSLRGIYSTIEESASAWDDRDYWKKAEALRGRTPGVSPGPRAADEAPGRLEYAPETSRPIDVDR